MRRFLDRRASFNRGRIATAAGGGATPFIPTDIAGLVGWFDMLDPTSFNESGGTMVDITNKATSTVHNTGTMPLYSATAVNGHPGMDFVPASGHHILGADAGILAALDNSSPHTIFFVGKTDVTNATRHFFGTGDAGQAVNRTRVWGFSSIALWRTQSINDAGTTVTVVSAGASDTNVHIFRWTSPGTTVSLNVDGVAADPNAAAMNPGTLTHLRYALGARARTTVDQHHDGKFGELLIYDSELSAPNIALVETYLARWNP